MTKTAAPSAMGLRAGFDETPGAADNITLLQTAFNPR